LAFDPWLPTGGLTIIAAAPPPPPPPTATANASLNTLYLCPNGHILAARYPDPKTAVIVWRGQEHTLTAGPSADGVRYVGDGLQWWTKGMRAGSISVLPAGRTIADPGPNCAASQ
ncbi:MAG: MliC family protein, partial [Caulobacteraceae bacterium]